MLLIALTTCSPFPSWSDVDGRGRSSECYRWCPAQDCSLYHAEYLLCGKCRNVSYAVHPTRKKCERCKNNRIKGH